MWTRRQLIDGIRRRTRAGTPWRDVPERYGPWGRVYGVLRRRGEERRDLQRKRGICGRNRPAGSPPSRTITVSDARTVA
ncbi:transposase [Streptomyces achromogenes]|uniref:transposase n=1 Tax=Streptomyces achromogenes TaxID=67255 RepID=UPI0036B29E5D